MSVKRITRDYVSGVQMFFCLITMLERAIRDVTPPVLIYKDKPSGGKKYWRFYVGGKKSKPYYIGIDFNQLDVIRFRFVDACFDPKRVEALTGWRMVRNKPARDFRLNEEFFELDAGQQKSRLTQFISQVCQEADQIRLAWV